MTKKEMREKFLELSRERRDLITDLKVESAQALTFGEKIDAADKLIEINKRTMDLLCQYILDKISPTSEEGKVWWAFVLNHLGTLFEESLDERQRGLYMGVSMTATFTETSLTTVDISKFPGGMKDE